MKLPKLPLLKDTLIIIFLICVIVFSGMVVYENILMLQEIDRISQTEDYEERAMFVANQVVESKIIEKLEEVYAKEYPADCTASELMGYIDLVNTFSIVTNIYLDPPKDTREAEQLMTEAGNCVPSITKVIEKKSESVYLVKYLCDLPDNCSLPNKSINIIIETNVNDFSAKPVGWKLPSNVRKGLGDNISVLDSFGNCSREMLYKISVELGIANLPEEVG